MEYLKTINELKILELPLERKIEVDYRLGIKENDLEEYLNKNRYNVYNYELITNEIVNREDLTVDSVLLTDAMIDLGFSNKMLDDETNLFYIENEKHSRYIEIIQEVCGAKSGIDYSVDESDEDCLFSTIIIEDMEDDKEYKVIYSFENDDYVINEEKNIVINKIKTLKDNIKIDKNNNLGWHWLDDDTFVSEFKINKITKEMLDTENDSIEIEHQLDTGKFYYSTCEGDWDDYQETYLIESIDMSIFNIDVLKFIDDYAINKNC